MEVAAELLAAVQAQREVVTRLEAELSPRRALEAKALAELEGRLAELQARVTSSALVVRDCEAQRPGLEAQLGDLEAGLSRARRAWVRLLEPVLASTALLLALLAGGLTGWKSWPWQLGGVVAGLVVQQVIARRRRG